MAFNSYMHERNIYRNQPDFAKIALDFPAFRKYAIPDAKGKKVHVDFSNPEALRMVTEILLKRDFNLDVEIPQGFLIPTVPQRLNYILWLEDLLNNIPDKKNIINGIDIGTGPCAIFSILGARKNNWNFVATESSEDAIHWAKKNIGKNNLKDNIKIVKVTPGSTLSEILSSNEENYDFCLCNPPFFENIEEIRKKHRNSFETIADVAQREEIFYKGGEVEFVKNILSDSLLYKNRISVFTSMFGKKKSFLQILKEIREIKDAKVTTTEFCQGNTIRWGIAWTFNESIQIEKLKGNKKIKPKKAKPPLEYQIPLKNSKDFDLKILAEHFKNFLKSLQIHVSVERLSQYFAEILLKSDKNTWTHQRRMRREMERQKKLADTWEKPLSAAESGAFPIQKVEANSDASLTQRIGISVDTNVSDNNDAVTSISMGISTEESNVLSNLAPENNSLELQSRDKTLTDCKSEIVCNSTERNTELSSNSKQSVVSLKPASNHVNFSDNCNVSSNEKRKNTSHNYASQSKKSKLDEDHGHSCFEQGVNTSANHSVNDSVEPVSLEENNLLSESSTAYPKAASEKLETKSEIVSVKNCAVNQSISSLQNVKNNIQLTDEKIDQSFISEDKRNFAGHLKSKKSKEDTGVKVEGELDSLESVQGSVLYCHLQLIKGKNKIYVKMNCPPATDRNTMHQVFLLIKNKFQ